MARYRKVDPRIWNDKKFRALDDQGKLVFFMLLTHPHMTAIGAMRASSAGLADELGWTPKAFAEAFAEVLSNGMAKYDDKACLVWLPNFIRYNQPESPNVVKAWDSALDLLPECNLKDEVIQGAKAFAEGMTEGFVRALPEAFAKGMPYQEQEQEQEIHTPPVPKSKTKPKTEKQPLPDGWYPSESTITDLSNEFALRAEDVDRYVSGFRDACAANGYTYKDFNAAFRNCVRQDWPKLRGRNGKVVKSVGGTPEFSL